MECSFLTESHKSTKLNNGEDKLVIVYSDTWSESIRDPGVIKAFFLSFSKIVFSYIESSSLSRHKLVAGSDDGDREPINCVLLSGSLSRVVWAHWIFYHLPWISGCKTVANIVCLFPHNKRLAVYSS